MNVVLFCKKKSERRDQIRISGGWRNSSPGSPRCCLAISRYSSASGFLHGTFFREQVDVFSKRDVARPLAFKKNSWFILRFISGLSIFICLNIWFIYMFIYVYLVISGSTIWFKIDQTIGFVLHPSLQVSYLNCWLKQGSTNRDFHGQWSTWICLVVYLPLWQIWISWGYYPLVIYHSYWKSPCLMGKSTISMVIFNSYFDITRGYSQYC